MIFKIMIFRINRSHKNLASYLKHARTEWFKMKHPLNLPISGSTDVEFA